MTNNCKEVIFSDKAYNELIRESFAMHPVETGGLLLGYVVNGTWVVMEVVPPGYSNAIHQTSYFEYDQEFVNYLIPSIANRYKDPLQLLGLWHRHPGSMDYFSATDDATNSEFASISKLGAISGLVNIDPSFRLTMYHLDHFEKTRPRNVAYSKVNVEIGDDFIPDEFFALRYVDKEKSDLHPTPANTNAQTSQNHGVPKSSHNEVTDGTNSNPQIKRERGAGITKVSERRNPRKHRNLIFTIALAILVFSVGLIIGIKAFSPSQNLEEVNTNPPENNNHKTNITESLLSAITNTSNIKYYPYTGTLTEGDSIYNIALSFVLADSIINEAIYTNLKYGGKIKMKVEQLNDSVVKLNGRDGTKDFFIELKSSDPKRLIGNASIGEKKFRVSLSHNILTNKI